VPRKPIKPSKQKRNDKSQQPALHQSLRQTLILSSPQKAALFQPRPKTND